MSHNTQAPVSHGGLRHQPPAATFGQVADALHTVFGLTIRPSNPERRAEPGQLAILTEPDRPDRPGRPRLLLADGLSLDDQIAALNAAGRALMAGDDAPWRPASPDGWFISLTLTGRAA